MKKKFEFSAPIYNNKGKLIQNADLIPVKVKFDVRKEAHKMVEEYMLLAN
jgi:hypothetical protein